MYPLQRSLRSWMDPSGSAPSSSSNPSHKAPFLFPSSRSSSREPCGLPVELWLMVFDGLDYKTTISLESVCRAFRDLCRDDLLWLRKATKLFRLPANNLYEPNCMKQLFKNLGNSSVYTWGQNSLGKLGHSYPIPGNTSNRTSSGIGIPLEIRSLRNEVVVDIKAGGWSTTILTAQGYVYSFGSMRGLHNDSTAAPTRVQFASPDSTIAQISSGRAHALALSDDGQIFTWYNFKSMAERVVPITGDNQKIRKVQKIVAGWECSAALTDQGSIVVWPEEYTSTVPNEKENEKHVKVVNAQIIPGTNHVSSKYRCWESQPQPQLKRGPAEDQGIGEVLDFIVDEKYLIILTTEGRVFAVDISNTVHPLDWPVQLEAFSAPKGLGKMVHISGSFRRFAVFNKEGLVYIGTQSIVQDTVEKLKKISPIQIPGLQNRGVVQIAFGDYHCLAVTKDLKLFSWGTESQACGCLGLGGKTQAAKRGVVWEARGNGVLDEPKEVFFDDPPYPQDTESKHGKDSSEDEGDFIVGKRPDNRRKKSKYLVFNAAAAGWHSGALVLINDCDDDTAEDSKTKVDQREELKFTTQPRSVSNPKEYQEPTENRASYDTQQAYGAGTTSNSTGKDEYEKSRLLPMKERGHPKGIQGMQSSARGGHVELSQESIANGGTSFFNMQSQVVPTGGALQLGEGDRLSRSREAEIERSKQGSR